MSLKYPCIIVHSRWLKGRSNRSSFSIRSHGSEVANKPMQATLDGHLDLHD